MQFLHVADVHLGKRQYGLEERERDFYKAFEEVVDIAIRERVDAFVVAGDLFDSPVPYHSLEPLRVAIRQVERLRENGIEVILVPGDHDVPKRRGSPSIQFLSEYTGAKLLKDDLGIKGVEVKGIKFYGVKAFNPERKDELKQHLQLFKALESRANSKAVLIAHVGVCELLPFQCIDMGFLPKGFGYYALGHIHKYITKVFSGAPLVYPGSLEVVSREEVEEARAGRKGPVLVDTSDFSYQKIKVDVRPQVILKLRSTNDLKLLSSVPKGAVVHLRVWENMRPYLDSALKKLKDKVLTIRVETVKEGLNEKEEVKKASPKVVSVERVLAELYGEELGSKLVSLLEAARESTSDTYEELMSLYKSGVWKSWRKYRRAS